MEWLNNFLTSIAVVLLVSVSLALVSPRWNYRVKMSFAFLSLIVSSMMVIPYVWITKNPYAGSKFWGKILLPVSKFLGLKWKIVGQENIDNKKTYVVVANHQSALDVLATTQVISSFSSISLTFLFNLVNFRTSS